MSTTNTVPQTPAPDGHEAPEQPRSLVSAAVSEAKTLWAATLTSAESVRACQYGFLGATYEHARLISANPAALEKLRTSLWLWVRCPSKRARKRLESAGAPELILAAALGLGDGYRSLRSKYKRVLEAAASADVPANRESFHDWLRQEGGIVKVLGKDPLVNHPSDARGADSGAVRSSASPPERKESMAALRCELLAKSVDGMSPIPMIGNAPPADTFVAVIYRADAGRLVPCLCSDETTDVDAFLTSVAHHRDSGERRTETLSGGIVPAPTHGIAVQEAA